MYRCYPTFPATLALAALPLMIPATLAATVEPPSEQTEALGLYARGRYAEALPLLERIDAAGQASGALLYRLAYCQRIAGDGARAGETERRALESLERESVSTSDLEVPFYLANAYRNAGRAADAQRVAAEATARVERGEIPRPQSGAERFQLGKLYADQERADLAAEWYGKAVDLLTGDPSGERSYVRWASRFLAERAFRAGDYSAAARFFGLLFDEGEGNAADLEKLAVSRARTGQYAEAAAAWARAGLENPTAADHYRYSSRLAALAAELPAFPRTAPVGKPWSELTREELEVVMKEESDRAKGILADAREVERENQAARAEFKARLSAPKAAFVGAALEYALRGYGIRETAFLGGYAPLILKPTAWHVRGKPQPEQPE